jgi:hypothetical protein
MDVFVSMATASRMRRPAAALLIAMIVTGAGASASFAETSGAQDKPPSSDSFEVGRPHFAKRGDAYVLVHSITSSSRKDRFWALVEVNNPDGSRKCEWLKTIEPKASYRFECPVENVAGQTYASRLRLYTDAELERREVHYTPELRVTPEALAAADKTDAASADKADVVADGVFEGLESAPPVTFKPTWYRRVDRGFAMRAYEHSGDLTIAADELLFVDGKKTVRIPYAKLQSVRWEPMPNDIANHWVIVRFTDDAGKVDGVGFRDGGRLGGRQGTGKIYQAVRRAAKK